MAHPGLTMGFLQLSPEAAMLPGPRFETRSPPHKKFSFSLYDTIVVSTFHGFFFFWCFGTSSGMERLSPVKFSSFCHYFSFYVWHKVSACP